MSMAGKLRPSSAQKVSGAPHWMSRPSGMKYMFATQCSKPAATKALTGRMMARILSVTLRAPSASHTARQTSTLHRIPRKNAWVTGSPLFVVAI